MELPPEKDWPWPGASNTFVPLVPDKVDSLTARIAHAALKPDPLWVYQAVDPVAEQYEAELEGYYAYKARKLRWRRTFWEAIHLGVRDGVGCIEVEHRQELEKRPQFGYNEEGVLQVRNETTVVFDDTDLLSHRLKDIYLIPAYSEKLEKAYGLARRFWLRPFEARIEAKAGRFYPDILKAAAPTATDRQGYDGASDEDTTMGQVEMVTHEASDLQEWECFVFVIRYDADNDGFPERCRFLFQKRESILLSAETYPYSHRQLNTVGITPMPRPKSPYGIALPLRLEPIQEQLNAEDNQKRDGVTIRNSPPLKRLANSPTKLDAKAWGPAQMYDVQDMSDMQVMEIPDIPASVWLDMKGLFDMADRLSASASFPIMKEDVTKAEVQATASDPALKFDDIMQAVLDQISTVGELVFFVDRQRVAENQQGLEYYVERNGRFVKQVVRPEAFQYDYDIRANGSYPSFDSQQARRDFLFVYDLLLKNPLLIGIPNVTPPNMLRIYHLTRQLMQRWDMREIESIIGKEEEYHAASPGGGPEAEPGALGGPGGDGSMAGVPAVSPGFEAVLGNEALLRSIGGNGGGAVGGGAGASRTLAGAP